MRRLLGAALPAAMLLGLTASTTPATAVAVACPVVVEHRTDPLDAPENTVPGIAAAAKTGAGWVEMDVRWTKSHFPILMHDPTVDRTTTGTGNVADKGLTEVGGLLANDYAPWKTDPRYSTTHVPYAYDFLHAVAVTRMSALLHLPQNTAPTADDMSKLVEYLTRTGMTGRVMLMGGYDVIKAIRPMAPGLHYALIEYNPATTWRRGSSVRALGVTDYVVPARDVTDPGIVASWHASGLTVWTWTSDTPAIDVPATWTAMEAAGVDAVITNRAADVLARLCPAQPTATVPTTTTVELPPPTSEPTTPTTPSQTVS
jgi:glycerophosphoryl diester phosphodiesterase